MKNLFNGTISYKRIGKEKVTVFNGYLGKDFFKEVSVILSPPKYKALFISLYDNELSFYSYFTLEVYEYILHMLKHQKEFGIEANTKMLNILVSLLKNTTELRFIQHTGMDQTIVDRARTDSADSIDYKEIKKKMNFGILSHQKVIFEDYAFMKYINHVRGKVMAADPGTGKTFSALALSEGLKSDKVIVIAPKPTLESVWVDSLIGEMYRKSQPYWVTTESRPYRNEKFIIVHYEFIPKLKEMLSYSNESVCFIVDESHNLNEKGTARDKAMSELMLDVLPDDVILLSGTAIKGGTLEPSNLLKFTDANFTPTIEKIFEALYKSPNAKGLEILTLRYKTVETFVSVKSMKSTKSFTNDLVMTLKNGKYYELESIKTRMQEYAKKQLAFYNKGMSETQTKYIKLRDNAYALALKAGTTTKADFAYYNENIDLIVELYEKGGLGDIPKKIREANAYEKILSGYLKGEDLKAFREVTTIIKYVSWKIQGEVLARVVMRTRIDLAKDFANELDYKKILTMTKKKTLFFSSYGEVCEICLNAMSKFTKGLGVFWGHTANITQIVKDFHTKDEHQGMVVTYKSMAAAIPVTIANLTVFFDLPFKSYIYGQAIARTQRKGQDEDCYYLQLLLDTGDRENINSRNVDIIALSKAMVEAITDRELDLTFKEMDAIAEKRVEELAKGIMTPSTDLTDSLLDLLGIHIASEGDKEYLLNWVSDSLADNNVTEEEWLM